MNKTSVLLGLIIGITLLFLTAQARALSPETEVLLELLQAKGVINKDDAAQFRKTIEERMVASGKIDAAGPEHQQKSAQGVSERLEKLEKGIKEGPLGPVAEKVRLSGFAKAEGNYTATDGAVPGTVASNSSDLTLADAELDVDVTINDYVSGHLAFLYQEDDTEQVTVDEGIISISGKDNNPFALHVGKMYVPFGRFETRFISDPLTLLLGETGQTAVLGSYTDSLFETTLGVFNGDIDETGTNNNVRSYVASAAFTLPEATMPDFGLTAGASYISNIADTDRMGDTGTGNGVLAATINDPVGGASVFVQLSYLEKYFLDAEYVAAVEEFGFGELGANFIDTATKRYQPRTWNIELAYALTEKLDIAGRYEGSDDFESIHPENQYGAAILYTLFDNTTLTLEYLYGDFRNNDTRNSLTTQLAIYF